MPVISIPKPCDQQWESFPAKDAGRFCSQCEKIILDFSQMTDAELLQFMKTNGGLICGRFHHTQLDRPIQIFPKTTVWQNIRKHIAALLAILSLRSMNGKAEGLRGTLSENLVWHQKENSKGKESSDVFVIEGKVIDEFSKPITGARVTIGTKELTTDTSGKFSLEINAETASAMLIVVDFDQLIPVVRNYHPAMLSTFYDIVLVERKPRGYYSMGLPVLATWEDFEKPAIKFSKGFLLNKDQQHCLSNLAIGLRTNPNTPPLRIIGYGKTVSEKKLAQKRIDEVYNYLIEKQGITAERLKTVLYNISNTQEIEFSFE